VIDANMKLRTWTRPTLLGLILTLLACGNGGGGSDNGPNGNPSDPPTTPQVQLTASASRTSGVAPLGVFFNASVDTTADAFHDMEYVWAFGDPASGNWADSGAARNMDKGPMAAHIFERVGDYAVTLTVRSDGQTVASEAFTISVASPDTYYADGDTICLSTSSANDFSGCPDGAGQMLMDDVDELPNHISSGKRVLLRRGDEWTTDGSASYANIAGPVTVGAYGSCASPDDRGICANAPRIHLTGDEENALFNLYRPSDWRIQDLSITGETTRWGAIGGVTDMQSVLLLRLKLEGFTVPLGNSHWDTDGHDQYMIVDCDVSGAQMNGVYIGSERLVLMGNDFRNISTSHVLRVWQAYMGVIGHNTLSGSSLDSDSGRHALKLHGPSQEVLANAGDGEGGLVHPTRFVVITDNIFGGSGPWPVAIGPQDSSQDERLRDIVLEKNRFFPGYGEQSCCSSPVQISLNLWASHTTVRNNIFAGTGSSQYFTAISIDRRGGEPTATNNQIYNNTIFKSDLLPGYTACTGISIGAEASQTVLRNNLVHFPAETVAVSMIDDDSGDLLSDHNLLTATPGLTDPDNTDWLQKDFSLQNGSPAQNQGADVPVWDDCEGNPRPSDGAYDLGAFEK
jgi:PKD repeat protein